MIIAGLLETGNFKSTAVQDIFAPHCYFIASGDLLEISNSQLPHSSYLKAYSSRLSS